MLQNKVVAGHKDCCEPVYETASAHPFPQDTNSKLVDGSAEVVLVELVVYSVHPFPPLVQLTQMHISKMVPPMSDLLHLCCHLNFLLYFAR